VIVGVVPTSDTAGRFSALRFTYRSGGHTYHTTGRAFAALFPTDEPCQRGG
jgi:hypothetical protein